MHCIQPKYFGEFDKTANTGHLNDAEARLLLLLEINALMQVLQTEAAAKRDAVIAALCARYKRAADFGRLEDEAYHEILEGMATYTEIALFCPNKQQLLDRLNEDLTMIASDPSSAIGAGYFVGALYCFAIDEFDADARRGLRSCSEMGAVLKAAAGISTLPAFEQVDFEAYGLSAIIEAERIQAKEQAELIEALTEKFSKQPTLSLEGEGEGSIMGQKILIDGLGTVLRGVVEYIGEVGRAVVNGGDALKLRDGLWKLSAIDMSVEGNTVRGNNWELTLNEGYAVKPDDANFVIKIKQVQ